MTTDNRAVEILKKCDLFRLYTFDEFMDYSPIGSGVILNGSRERANVIHRQIAATIAYLKTRNVERAGRLVNLDHATVVYSVKVVHNSVLTKDQLFLNAVRDFENHYNECKEMEFGIAYAVAMRTLEGQINKEFEVQEKRENQRKINELELTIKECKHEISNINQIK